MSGLCGWTNHGSGADANRRLAHAMASPLSRYDRNTVHVASADTCAVAAAGRAHVARHGSVLVALWGGASLHDGPLAEQAAAEGLASALASGWRTAPESLCRALTGPFALALVDAGSGDALLAVDRMGAHPLSYRADDGALVFASHADAIALHPLGRQLQADPQGIFDYVYFHMVPSPGHVWQGVRRLLPGEMLEYRGGRASVRRYWKMRFDEDVRPDFGAMKERFVDAVRDSVREAGAGCETGAFLSGGTDSSTIAGMLCQVGGRPARTYSIGFDAQGYDEMEYARIAARHFGTDHHEYYVTPDDVADAIPEVARAFDQPFGNASAVPAYMCARLARQDGIERLLGGDGGDELFGGNERYARQHVFALYEKLPQPLRGALIEPALRLFPLGGAIAPVRKARSYVEQARVPMPARLETYNLLGRYGAGAVFEREFLAHADSARPLASLEETWSWSEARTLINRMLELDLKITLADNDLPKVTGACQMAGIDVAFPFLHHRVVDFSAGLPPSYKLRGLKLRWFFKEALRGFLPDEIIAKQKHGFGLPFGVWLGQHDRLRQLAGDSLSGLKSRGIVRPQFIDDLLARHLPEHPGYHGTMVWVLMMLEQWFQQRASRPPVPDRAEPGR
ncbi:asparagine synthetase B family protein [Pseudoduganella sp. GCM10020061]|uniref:asparagine synthetase B family protein n=1 Tax=Pseudoduganella sp. GCM10020061 TaxID=3317345 RepID=UPI00362F93C3